MADAAAPDELVNKWKSRSTATLVIDGEVIITPYETLRAICHDCGIPPRTDLITGVSEIV